MSAARPRAAAPALAAAFALAAVLALAGCGHVVMLHDPLSAAEHNDLGVAYQAAGRPDLAEREFRSALRLDRRFARAWLNLGNVAAARGRWGRAAEDYRRALAADPRSADAMNNLAFALVRLPGSRLDEAERLARAAVEAGGARDSIYRATLEEVRHERAARRP